MRTLLILTDDLQPPWDSGLKVYGRGLHGALQEIEGIDLTTISPGYSGDLSSGHSYDYVHVVQTGFTPFYKALKRFKHATVFKHIVTPSIGFRNALATKICYSLVNSFENRLVRCFSSRFVASSYFMNGSLIVPPSVDTTTFTNNATTSASARTLNREQIFSMLQNSPVKSGIDNIRDDANSIILYSGPLTKDRFPYRKVLDILKETTKSKLLIIGRATNNGAGANMVQDILSYTRKIDLENRVSIAVKLLEEHEKVALLNFADVVIQPFENRTQTYVAIDPPIFLLEAMACGKPVVTSKTFSFESLIRNGYNGYAIDWNNASEFREALNNCCQGTSKIGLNARQTVVEGFSYDYVSKKVQMMYNDYN